MACLSNGYGAVHYDEATVYGRRAGMDIGSLPRPLTPDDAKLFWAMCLSRVAGWPHPLSVGDALTMSKLMGGGWEMKLCERCAGFGEIDRLDGDGNNVPDCCLPCDGWGWRFQPAAGKAVPS